MNRNYRGYSYYNDNDNGGAWKLFVVIFFIVIAVVICSTSPQSSLDELNNNTSGVAVSVTVTPENDNVDYGVLSYVDNENDMITQNQVLPTLAVLPQSAHFVDAKLTFPDNVDRWVSSLDKVTMKQERIIVILFLIRF